MPIKFRCTCGKVMAAKDEFAGKKAKCVECGAVVVVPGPGPGEGVRPQPPSPPPMAESRERIQSGRPPVPPRREEPARSREEWDEDERPSRKPVRKRGMAGWMKAVIVVIILAVLGGGGWLLFTLLSGGGSSNQLALVPADGSGFGTIKVAELWNSKALEKVRGEFGPKLDEKLKEEFGLSINDIDRFTMAVAEKNWDTRPGFQPEMWFVIHTKVPMDQARITKKIPEHVEREAKGKKYHTSAKGEDMAMYFAGDKEVWLAPTRILTSLMDGSRSISRDGQLAESIRLASSDKHHLVMSFAVPEKIKNMMAGGPGGPGMPPEMATIKDFQFGQVVFNGSDGDLDLKLRFSNEGAAKQAETMVKSGLEMARGGFLPIGPAEAEMMRPLQGILNEVKVSTAGSEVTIRVPKAGDAIAGLAGPLFLSVAKVRDAAAHLQARNNLQQIAIAMHAYHDVYKQLPPARFKNGLSWRVAILPYVGEDKLYREFRLEEPWDSAHNIKLLERMPEIYKPVGGAFTKPGETCYQVFTGENIIFHPKMDRKSRLMTIPDGTSNTFLIVESARTVPWTAPMDIVYQPFAKQPMPPLGYQMPGEFLAAFGDASVSWFSNRIDQGTLDRLIDPRDGMPVDFERFRSRK